MSVCVCIRNLKVLTLEKLLVYVEARESAGALIQGYQIFIGEHSRIAIKAEGY